jgi:hypothetical protein
VYVGGVWSRVERAWCGRGGSSRAAHSAPTWIGAGNTYGSEAASV